MPPLSAYAVTAPGLEVLTEAELKGLGLETGPVEPGGVPFSADRAGLYRANLQLRTASRVLFRIGGFRAVAFNELEKQARRLPWDSLITPDSTVAFRVTCKKSRLYHDGAVEQRLQNLLTERIKGVRFGKIAKPAADGEEGEDATEQRSQLIVVRLFRDQCTIGLDSSGALLHRRGYRQAVAKAPLRENLAAALLLAVGWDGTTSLLDPMCGSGTIPIEAALLARRIPPGLRRGFAFEQWPDFDSALWTRIRGEAEALIRPAGSIDIAGSDRDEGAIEAALANATRAGVEQSVTFRRASISAIEARNGAGWLVTNPPYGVRVGDRARLRDLFAQLGNVARRRLPGWHLAFLSNHPSLEGQTGLALEPRLAFSNGGIRVRLMAGAVPRQGRPGGGGAG
jgi:putative N6-adenine-specific DNA methylase